MVVYRGWQGQIKVADTEVAQVEGWSVDVDNSTESHFVLGSRSACDISVGPKNVTGSISKLYANDTYADLAANPTESKPASFTFIGAIKEGIVSITCSKCMWSSWGGAGEADGAATESLDFVCVNIST